MRIHRIARFAGFFIALVAVLTACAPATSVNRETSTDANVPARSGLKSITVINSGVAPGLDNRFVVTI